VNLSLKQTLDTFHVIYPTYEQYCLLLSNLHEPETRTMRTKLSPSLPSQDLVITTCFLMHHSMTFHLKRHSSNKMF